MLGKVLNIYTCIGKTEKTAIIDYLINTLIKLYKILNNKL